MKNINLKSAYAARAKLEQARTKAEERRKCPRFYTAEAISRAEAAEEAARADYSTALQPLAAAIEEAEKRARVRLISARNVMDALSEVEGTLSIPKKHMDGVTVRIDLHAQHMPSAYHGIAESTQFRAVYKAGSWRVTEIFRAPVSSPSSRYLVTHTDDSRAAIVARLSQWY